MTVALVALNVLVLYFCSLSPLVPPELGSMLAPVLVHLSVWAACMHPVAIVYGAEWCHLLLAVFTHVVDTHVLYNAVRRLYKGVTLEAALGSGHFPALILFLAVV